MKKILSITLMSTLLGLMSQMATAKVDYHLCTSELGAEIWTSHWSSVTRTNTERALTCVPYQRGISTDAYFRLGDQHKQKIDKMEYYTGVINYATGNWHGLYSNRFEIPVEKTLKELGYTNTDHDNIDITIKNFSFIEGKIVRAKDYEKTSPGDRHAANYPCVAKVTFEVEFSSSQHNFKQIKRFERPVTHRFTPWGNIYATCDIK